ncbi:hypothetical protein [Adonisia turfae]|uniref:hypothetical protein n=1 Tax=Adonisia turfae TaxID=2950184 RepID=UPI002029AB08|nr:hypothetical protein [Adonisia turfae]
MRITIWTPQPVECNPSQRFDLCVVRRSVIPLHLPTPASKSFPSLTNTIMTPATPVNPSPEAPSINIPVNSDQSQSQAQLRSFLMALVHSYGLTAVLEALSEGM